MSQSLFSACRWTWRPASRATVCAAVSVLSACYEYTPTLNPVAGTGATVQVTLTDAGSEAVASQVGPRVAAIEGLCTGATADSLVLSVTQTTARGGVDTFWKGERVAVPRTAVGSFGVRRLSTTRTVIVSVVGVGAAVAAIASFGGGKTSQGGTLHPLPGAQ